jgi:DNA-binding SARP family transcriptional activator
LLAALLLHANIPVAADELAELVWNGSPPAGAIVTLRSYIKRLRAAVDPAAARIAAIDPGYVIHIEQAELDVLEFEALCRDTRAAARAGQWAEASAVATRALALWRAAPLLDVSAELLHREFVPRLERLRLQLLEDRFDGELRLGHLEELIPELLDMTARHPLQERFHAQLMLALAGTGRRAQALGAYQEARRLLVAELGIEPGRDLRDIHQQILADGAETVSIANGSQLGEGPSVSGGFVVHGDWLAAEAPARAPTEPAEPTEPADGSEPSPRHPAQLPADIADFTGRQAQAAYLYHALASNETASGTGAARVAVVAGATGLGKTALAVHVAHQVRKLFPGGQLYAHLSGASGQPALPGEVLARFLRDLGVDSDKIPAGDEERAALYRTRLAGQRVLILLDDAKDAAQVRPLLGSSSCAALVTTWNKTLYLVSTGLVDLDALPMPAALELFSRIAGDARPAAEPEATEEILRACAGLPLAIRICAARLATRPQWRLATMATRLRDERRRLDELQIGDLEVRASFQMSYDSLRASRHRADPSHAFRLLGLWQGQRISLPAAAALVGDSEEHVANALEDLVDANLLESPEPDWYQSHDLLRLFAAERAQAEETQEVRSAAVTRLLRWYLATATAAADALSPHRYRIPDEEALTSVAVPDPLDWYDREHANVIAAIRQAAAAGLHDLAWRLPTALFPFFMRRHSWASSIATHRIAVDSARLAGSRSGEAWALHNLGYGLARFSDPEAFSCLKQSAAIRKEMKDLDGEAQATISLTVAHSCINGPQAAYGHSLRSLELLRKAENPALLGIGLNNHGDICMSLGKADEATRYLKEALGILTSIGAQVGQGQVLENLGCIHLESGRLPEAIASLSEACRVFAAQGHLPGQAGALKNLGLAQHRADQPDLARKSLEAALALFDLLAEPTQADDTRSALAELVSEPLSSASGSPRNPPSSDQSPPQYSTAPAQTPSR